MLHAWVEEFGSFGLVLNDAHHIQVPYETRIVSSYPNPFNPIVTLDYTLENDSFVEIYVYNILGQKILQIEKDFKFRGENKVIWNGINKDGVKVSSGNYFINIITENNSMVKKVTLMK